MTAVLLTGSRAPATLDLARRFAEEGAFVVVADSEPALTSASRAVGAAYRVPSARFRPWEFAEAVAGIARRHAVDVVVPTCEETFWLAAVADAAAGVGASGGASSALGALRSVLFAPSIVTLRRLHDKAVFLEVLDEIGVPHPETEVVASRIVWRRRATRRVAHPEAALVVKPAFSRFGTRTRFVAAGEPLPEIDRITRDERWLVQERLVGAEFCTYAVAVDGRVTAFVAYRPVWRAGVGAGVAFERLDATTGPGAEARAIAERLAGHLGLTGQFGLDLMATATGVQVLECNPRATSGVHLFAPGDGLAGAFSGVEARPPSRSSARLAIPHAMYAAAGMKRPADAARWLSQLRATDALRPSGDRLPLPTLLRSVAVQARTARRAGISLTAASTHDLEWNGEPLLPRPPCAGPTATRSVPPPSSTLIEQLATLPSAPTVVARSAAPTPSTVIEQLATLPSAPTVVARSAAPTPSAAFPRSVPPTSSPTVVTQQTDIALAARVPAGPLGAMPGGELAPGESPLGERPVDPMTAFVEGVRAAGGTSAFVANVDVAMGGIEVGGVVLPVTSPRRGVDVSAAPAIQSYVVSPLTHYVRYAREELGELRSPAARGLSRAILVGLEAVLRAGRVDDVVMVGNALLSTNLLPDPDERTVLDVTARLVAAHPDHAIAWRSVHGRGSRLPETLRRAGYRLIPSRSVLFAATRDSEWSTLRDVERDRSLIDTSGYTVRRLPGPLPHATPSRDGASAPNPTRGAASTSAPTRPTRGTASDPDPTRDAAFDPDPTLGAASTSAPTPDAAPTPTHARIAELYRQLYIAKYSASNPQYTPAFIALAQRTGLLEFTVLERDGRIDGVFGSRVANGLLAAPLVGYDTTLPQKTGLYRMLSYLIAQTAHDAGVDLHNSSGVADFKRNRGGEPELEYTAVATRHLPARQRAAWAVLDAVVTHVAVPMITRSGL